MFTNHNIMYKKTQVLQFRKTALALALSQVLTLGTPAAPAATITVDTDSGGANDPNHCTLRDAITAANADAATGGCPAGAGADTIVLPAKATITLTKPDNPDNGLPVVTSSITIEGNGTTIKRDSDSPKFRIFKVNNGSLELRDTTISGGHHYIPGCGIFAYKSPVTLTNSTILGNYSPWCGGISAHESPVTLTNSTISGNSSHATGVICAYKSPATLTNSNVYKNSGGIFAESMILTNSTVLENSGVGISARSVTLINSTVSRNGSRGIGANFVTLINSTVSGNLADPYYGGGGGIYARGSVTLINSTVSGNSVSYLVGYSGNGGGIEVRGSATLINSTISGNSTPNGEGGGIHVSSLHQPDRSDSVLIQNSIIANNSGGDCVNNSGATLTATNNLIGDGGINCGTPLLTGDPKLGPLQKNGGPTPTHALLADSPAIDAGDDAVCDTLPKNARGQPTDQRGKPRAGPRAGSHCDIGAYEFRHRRRE